MIKAEIVSTEYRTSSSGREFRLYTLKGVEGPIAFSLEQYPEATKWPDKGIMEIDAPLKEGYRWRFPRWGAKPAFYPLPVQEELKEAKPEAPKKLAMIPGKIFPAEAPPTSKTEERKLKLIPIDAINSMPFQPRLDFPESEIAELAESIKKHGILQPILVRPSGEFFEMVAGERRLQAAKQAGLLEVSVIVRELSDQEAMEISLIENLHRKDPTDYEKARWLQEMMRKFPESYPTQATLAQRIGLSKGRVSQLLSMIDVIEKDEKFRRLNILKPSISADEVRAIMSVPPEKREEVIQEIAEKIEEGKVPSVREVKKIVKPPEEAALPSEALTPEAPAPEVAPETEVRPKKAVLTQGEIPEARDALLARAERYYPLTLIDEVWSLVTVEARRLPFLKVVVETLWEKAVEQDLSEQVLQQAKTRFEKPEEVSI